MKLKFYISAVLFFTFAALSAQSEVTPKTVKAETELHVTQNETTTVVLDTVAIKEAIAKSSDIRNYLNKEQKVENIKLVFPKMNLRKLS